MGTSIYSGSERYHSEARKNIPPFSSVLSHGSQMRRYRDQKSSTSKGAMTDPAPPPALPAPVSGVRPAPTRFKVQDSVFDKKSTHSEFSVEAEFQKYTSGSSLPKTDILQFWEVRYD